MSSAAPARRPNLLDGFVTGAAAFWTGLAAWLVGMRGRPLALAVLAGLVVSSVVLALQVMLQPGRAVEGATATGVTHPARETRT